ncbi:MAG: L-serine ammonia-lyase, iron-sulfur-dependent, subunit alpha, partial [Eggerthella sp.]|nr:L-serine ammonia-lyase, iron-sulfur-dependent, subunit alpha [Eggerthella sp.]
AQSISDEGVNIATTRMYRERKGDTAYTVLETDQAVGAEAKAAIEDHPAIYDVRIIPGDARADVERVAVPDVAAALQRFAELDFGNGAALLAYCEEHGATLSEAFLAREAALAASLGYADGAAAYLREALAVMRCAARRPIDEALPSMGGLIGGEARKLADLHERGGELCDDQLSCAIAYAMAVLETNASMGRIVAAPTAGSAGVLPGVLLALQRTRGYGDDDLAHGLAAAAAIGYLITRNATVSGAEGGCQAEVGSAAAMAAAASVELMGGTPAQCFAAASNALTNMMGLVCDPIAGLVEEPCQKRNAAGAAVALVSAQIALAGIGNLVDFDQTVEAMRKVGRSLPFVILMISIIPFTRLLVGTSLGWKAAVVPLTLAAAPFFARLVESNVQGVESGKLEAAKMAGASNWQIMLGVQVREALPSLIQSITVTLISLIGYGAMAGTLGTGGLGALAMNYGYTRFMGDVMLIVVIDILLIVVIVQWVGDMLSRLVDHR